MFVDIFKLLHFFNLLQIQKSLGELIHNHFGLVSIAINPCHCSAFSLVGWHVGIFTKAAGMLQHTGLKKVTEKSLSQGVNKLFKMLQY